MPYVHRVVQAGRTVEHRKMQSFRVHTKGVKRGPNKAVSYTHLGDVYKRQAPIRGPPRKSKPGSTSGWQKNTCAGT